MVLKQSFNNKGEIGKKGEGIVRSWLKKQGYIILPSSLIEEGGAPMLTGEHIKAILPNNLTWKEKQPGWVEVKTKSFATLHEKPPHRWEHGLPLQHWNAYLKVQELTNIPVSLAVLELDTKLLLIGSLDSLEKGKRVFYMEGKPHIFLNRLDNKNRSDFEQWYSINLSLPDPIQPLARRTEEQGSAPTVAQLPLLFRNQCAN